MTPDKAAKIGAMRTAHVTSLNKLPYSGRRVIPPPVEINGCMLPSDLGRIWAKIQFAQKDGEKHAGAS